MYGTPAAQYLAVAANLIFGGIAYQNLVSWFFMSFLMQYEISRELSSVICKKKIVRALAFNAEFFNKSVVYTKVRPTE